MPSKSRWALNPKKWFGTISSNGIHKQEKTNHLESRAPPTATTTTRTFPFLSTTKNKTNQINGNIAQLQLPAFCVRREKTSTLLTSSSSNRQNTFFPIHTEPTIRKNGRIKEQLLIDTTRWSVPTITTTKPIDTDTTNMPNRCLIDYPRHQSNILEESSFPTRSSSSSSIVDDNSSSSGIYTDERQLTESKETLSTLEVLSIESLADSHTSLNHFHTRPIIHHYRRPMSILQINDNHENIQPRQTSVVDKTISTSNCRQSSAKSPTTQLEKAGLKRIVNDDLSRKNSIDSFMPYSYDDDSLRSAKNEECYATLPRTCSTEQLNNHLQNDLHTIIDQCIRPIEKSIGKNRTTKIHQRYKRTQINHSHRHLSIDDITDKLISSIDYSIYARYQRC